MVHGLAHQHIRSYEKVNKWIGSWIASKDASFFRDGIRQLPERWEKAVTSDEQYFESYIDNLFLRIKPQILGKNVGIKVVHLIIRFRLAKCVKGICNS